MKGNDKLEETDWFPSDNFLWSLKKKLQFLLSSTLKEERTVHLLSTSAFYPTRSAHNSPLRSFSFVYIPIVAHLDYSCRIIVKEKRRKIHFLIYHLEINQPIKKIQFQSKSKSKIGEVWVIIISMGIMKQLSKNIP